VVAKNQYRITTSAIRGIRAYFPYLIIGVLSVYVALIAPAIVSPFIDDFLTFIITQAAIPLVQIILFMFFFFLILFPISDTLRELQTGQLEIFLAAPVKPSDVLLGEFLGKMPFYAIAIAVITGTFTAFLTPLGLDMAQIMIIIAVFVVTFLSAFWIGIVIAAVLGTKLGKIAKGKDVGRALAVVIVLPMIAVMYAILGGGLPEALADPGTSEMVRAAFSVLPSSWGAEIFVDFASNPSDIGAVGFETLTRFGVVPTVLNPPNSHLLRPNLTVFSTRQSVLLEGVDHLGLSCLQSLKITVEGLRTYHGLFMLWGWSP
jgi:hypothetical protein